MDNSIELQTGIEIFDLILPQIGIFFVIPLLGLIKRTVLAKWFKPVVWAGWLSIAATWAVSALWVPDATVVQIFQTAAAMTGSSVFVHALSSQGTGLVKRATTGLLSLFRI